MKESKPVISTQDIHIMKELITYYITNGPFLTPEKKKELSNLFHRLGRLNEQ